MEQGEPRVGNVPNALLDGQIEPRDHDKRGWKQRAGLVFDDHFVAQKVVDQLRLLANARVDVVEGSDNDADEENDRVQQVDYGRNGHGLEQRRSDRVCRPVHR